MTLRAFEQALQKKNPKLRIREAGYGDIAGIYAGETYLLRVNKGEIPLYSWSREIIQGYRKPFSVDREPIVIKERHRGRMQALALLVNYRHLTQRQAQEIMWGAE